MFAWTEDLFCFLLFSIAATIHTMAFLATTMLEVLVFITWACLSVPVHKNGLFTQLSSRQTILFEICSAASAFFGFHQHFVSHRQQLLKSSLGPSLLLPTTNKPSNSLSSKVSVSTAKTTPLLESLPLLLSHP